MRHIIHIIKNTLLGISEVTQATRKGRNSFLLLVFGTLLFGTTTAQNSNKDAKRYQFAKMYYGLDLNFTPNLIDGIALGGDEQIIRFDRHPVLTPALNLGATHFWGYADFYISISTADIQFGTDQFKNRAAYRVFTGLRLYPFPSKPKTLRPYIGYKFSALTYTQENVEQQSATTTGVRSFLDFGLAYQGEHHYFYLGYNHLLNNELNFALSRSAMQTIRVSPQFLSLGVNFTLDTTAGNENCQSCRHFDQVFGASNRRGWYLGIGLSAAFPMRPSSYISTFAPFLNQVQMPRVFPEISLGYHFTKSDLFLNSSFRSIVQRRRAYDYEQEVKRQSLVLEGFKTLGDYHGFVPYVGLGISLESLRLTENDRGASITDVSSNQLTPSFIFGWDIRPSRKGDSWVLRTNLRYAPFLELEHKGQSISVQQLEFNFIQFIYYPQRAKAYRTWRK
ncbi:MAG: hypothetical protein AAGI49_01680 [Bacteroidota bacterium]